MNRDSGRRGYCCVETWLKLFTALCLVTALAACSDDGQQTLDAAADAAGDAAGDATTDGPAGVSKKIEAAKGGTITTPDGKLKLEIPAGALAQDTVITITPLTSAKLSEEVWYMRPLGPVYSFGPDGLKFSKPATLTRTMDVAELAPVSFNAKEVPLLLPLQVSAGKLAPLDGAEQDATQAAGKVVVSAALSHFSHVAYTAGSEFRARPKVEADVGQQWQGDCAAIRLERYFFPHGQEAYQRWLKKSSNKEAEDQYSWWAANFTVAVTRMDGFATQGLIKVGQGVDNPQFYNLVFQPGQSRYVDALKFGTMGFLVPKVVFECLKVGEGHYGFNLKLRIYNTKTGASTASKVKLKGEVKCNGIGTALQPRYDDSSRALDFFSRILVGETLEGCDFLDERFTKPQSENMQEAFGDKKPTSTDRATFEKAQQTATPELNKEQKKLSDGLQKAEQKIPQDRKTPYTDPGKPDKQTKLPLKTRGVVRVKQSSCQNKTLTGNTKFPCGAGEWGYTVCPPGVKAMPAGEVLYVWAHHAEPIEMEHKTNHYQYGFVFDADNDAKNNYVPPAQYKNDLFGGTDKWYEVLYTPTGGWTLKVRDIRKTVHLVSSAARVLITHKTMVLMVPRSEFEVATPKYRVTSFRHSGDWGKNPPHDWDGDLDPRVGDPLAQVSSTVIPLWTPTDAVKPTDAGPDSAAVDAGVGKDAAPWPATSGWTSQKLVPSVGGFYGVWGSSPFNIYAVGEQGAKGVIAHYSGSAWAKLTAIPSTGVMWEVWGSSATDIWVASDSGMVHFDGKGWALQNTGALAGKKWKGVHGTSGSNVYAVGDNGAVARYDGKAWTTVNHGLSMSGKTGYGVWTSGVYVFVAASGGVMRYDGKKWTYDALPQFATASGDNNICGVWGTSPSHVWAVSTHTFDTPSAFRFDGLKWNYVSVSSAGTHGLHSVWGTAGNDIHAAGNLRMLIHYDGTKWSAAKSGTGMMRNMFDVWAFGANKAVAVGNDGAYQFWSPSTPLPDGGVKDGPTNQDGGTKDGATKDGSTKQDGPGKDTGTTKPDQLQPDAPAVKKTQILFSSNTSPPKMTLGQVYQDGTGYAVVSGLPSKAQFSGARPAWGGDEITARLDRPQRIYRDAIHFVHLPGGGQLHRYDDGINYGIGLIKGSTFTKLDEGLGTGFGYGDAFAAVSPDGKLAAMVKGKNKVVLIKLDGTTWSSSGSAALDVSNSTWSIYSIYGQSLRILKSTLVFVTQDTIKLTPRTLWTVPLSGSTKATKVTLPQVGGATAVDLDYNIAVSTDRTRVAFTAGTSSTAKEVMVMEEGKAPIIVSKAVGQWSGAGTYNLYSWDPRLAFSTKNTYLASAAFQPNKLWIIKADGSSKTEVSTAANFKSTGMYFGPFFWADDDNLIFGAGNDRDFYHYQVSTKKLSNITKTATETAAPWGAGKLSPQGGWVSPNGKFLYLLLKSKNASFQQEINIVAIDLTAFTKKYITTGLNLVGGWNSGSQARWASLEGSSKVWFSGRLPGTKSPYTENIYVFDQNAGTVATKLTSYGASYDQAYYVVPSPDEKYVAYRRGSSSGFIYVVPTAGGTPIALMPKSAKPNNGAWVWAADSSVLYYGAGSSYTTQNLYYSAVPSGTQTLISGAPKGYVQVFGVK